MKVAILALVAMSSFAGVANAQPIFVDAGGSRTSQVAVGDLNLAAAQGRATAAQRIRGAAAEVCANDGDRSLTSQLAAHDCIISAVDGGLRQLQTTNASISTTTARGF